MGWVGRWCGGGGGEGGRQAHAPHQRSNAQRNAQAWACVRIDSAPAGAVCPPPPDLACFVYDEERGAFAYWGRNSALRLTQARSREQLRRLARGASGGRRRS